MIQTNELRQLFLNYFAEREHTIVPSSSLIPVNDPTLLFTNAGMNQFKDVFLGKETRDYKRAATAQCCMRVSGKHNDLENVGYTARHHTFFEMLGNFSFGDYFKREAISFAWGFLTEVLHVDSAKLWVTVYKDDKEAEQIWLNEIKVDPKRFSRCDESSNFWTMGDTGPCGPCSEIYYDHGAEFAGDPPGMGVEGDRFVEIWNLVFMQFNRSSDGELKLLPEPSIDTGMGLERIAAVVQGVHDNYDIDIFKNIIKEIMRITRVKDEHARALRVIADHIRSAAFLLADGVVPANEGRGYVLRRIIRRAIRHGHQLGVQEPFFYKLLDVVSKEMGDAYPKLVSAQKMSARILYQEEQQFAATLTQGMQIFEREIKELSSKVIPGSVVFKLYDTYGFPVDLTADIAREHDLTIDESGFLAEMERQKQMSRQAQKFICDYNKIIQLEGETEFVGYDKLVGKGKLIFLIKDDDKVDTLTEGDEGVLVLDRTPFYAEAGGQVGDTGYIGNDKFTFRVKDTRKQGAIYLHYGQVDAGSATVGMEVDACVDRTRLAIAANHTATHLLHAALREVLGSHVEQRGSLVSTEKLRFDFSHFDTVTAEELHRVETIVNQKVRANLAVCVASMSFAQAKEQGAMAIFSEKYGEQVRVISLGDFSKELCGGAHVNNTGEIGLFKITSESSVAAGIRRIEAVTATVALDYVNELERQLREVAALLRSDIYGVVTKTEHLLEHVNKLDKELATLKQKVVSTFGSNLLELARTVNGIKVLVTNIDDLDAKALRSTVDRLREQLGHSVIVLSSVIDGKIQLIAGVSKELTAKINAGELVSFVAQQIGGSGGGRADMAQGGGTNIDALDAALDSVHQLVAEKL